jgi:hypothetical protein
LTLFLLIGSSIVWGDLTPTQRMAEAAKSLYLAYPSLALGSFKPYISTKTRCFQSCLMISKTYCVMGSLNKPKN